MFFLVIILLMYFVRNQSHFSFIVCQHCMSLINRCDHFYFFVLLILEIIKSNQTHHKNCLNSFKILRSRAGNHERTLRTLPGILEIPPLWRPFTICLALLQPSRKQVLLTSSSLISFTASQEGQRRNK